jgi:hypothetical protein
MDNPTQTPEEILKRIQGSLNSSDAKERLGAIQELLDQKYSSPAILRALERMALKDKSKAVREASRQALDSPTHRYIQGRTAKLKRKERQTILDEIAEWETQGLIQEDQAVVIRRRYDFDLKPAASAPLPDQEAPPPSLKSAPDKITSPAEQPTPPTPSLTQTLLSETSIKIALYLGSFFVIAAAAILAAVVEAARLPILFIATVLFAGGALVTRKRLPQPSFALFIVFSFLLPTDANVLADVLNLPARANAGYWFIVMAIMALLWGLGTWFYTSRLFSLAAFVALIISVIRLGEFLDSELEMYMLLLSFATLIGLGGAYILKRWQSSKFSRPLFILVQIAQVGLNLFALIVVVGRIEETPNAWNLVSTFFWLLTAGFYALSNLAFPFVLFPWLAAAALYPVPMAFIIAFNTDPLPVAIAAWVWGTLLAAGSEALRLIQVDKVRRYELHVLTISTLTILTAILVGFIENNSWGFAFMLASAILYTVLQVLKPRLHVWISALLLGLGAYFTFFALPFMEKVDVFIGYQLLGASLLLLLPDLFLKPDFSINKSWRWPLRIFGSSLVFANTLTLVFIGQENAWETTLIFALYTLFFTLYALRYRRAWLGYFGAAFAALSVVFAILHFEIDSWLLPLMVLSALYYLAGFLLGRNEKTTAWSNMLRFSGLGLSSIASLTGVITSQDGNGWYALITGLLFGIEMFAFRANLAEVGVQIFFATGVFALLVDSGIEVNYQYLGVSLALLGTDLALARTYPFKRPLAWISRGFGALFMLINTLDILFTDFDTRVSAICLTAYMLFFLLQAFLYRFPALGYGFSLYSVLTIITTLKAFERDGWLLPVTALAIIFYAAGFILRKQKMETDEQVSKFALKWPFVLWTSGLGIGLLVTVAAPLEGGLSAAIPVAVTATMIAMEALDRRDVWLGFPANALYLMAYFILLLELNVDEPQFFSIATAALGLLMHYLLTRAGSRTGAFITGMVSQLVLLGTTYIQFVSTERLSFFAILFFQALAVLIYGIVIRSRSLVITPIIIVVIAVMTVLFGLLQDIGTIVMIGCTGIILLMLGILAVVMRERIKEIGDRFNDWKA